MQVPILKAIEKNPDLQYFLIVSGAHLDPDFGATIKEIKEDGFSIYKSINLDRSEDNLISTANAIGQGVIEITKYLE